MKPNILMFHRIKLNDTHSINELYFKRNMVTIIEVVFKIIETYLSDNKEFGSIEQCLNSNKYFHLSFDDGFKEHLEVATILKDKYKIPNEAMSFSINVGNSIYGMFSGMDIVYELIRQDKIDLLLNILKLPKYSEILDIKERLLIQEPGTLFQIHKQLKDELKELKSLFMSKDELKELSKLFLIASHGVSHRNLIQNKKYSKQEIIKSKKELENIINHKINIFCYPEGKNDIDIQDYVKTAGYKYGLSIRNEKDNNYCIGRLII